MGALAQRDSGMKRVDLEHIIRAAAAIANDDEIVVIGSQAILGSLPDAPEVLLRSMEADVFPKNRPEQWNTIDGSIGEGSIFHETFGYYAQGVSRATATLPEGWEDRLVRVVNQNTRGAVGLCLEPHDLAIAKAAANRDKDKLFVTQLLAHGLVELSVLLTRCDALALAETERQAIKERLQRWALVQSPR